jgi:O-antigen ligase
MTFNIGGIGSEGRGERFTAFGFSLNTLAGLLAVAFVTGMGLLLNGTFTGLVPISILLLSLLFLLKASVATGSRSGIATAIIGCMVYLYSFPATRKKGFTIGMLMIGVAVSVWLVISSSVLKDRWEKAYYDNNLSGRTVLYPTAVEMFLEKPVFGWGAETHLYELGRRTGELWRRRDEHNLVLYLLAEVGLMGTIPFLAGVWLVVRAAWRARSENMGYVRLAVLVAVGANNMVENGLDFRSKLFWLALALAARASPTIMKRTGSRRIARDS